jgi:hypothetical protein
VSLLLPQHTKLKEQISEVLDADLIKQQAEKGILDFQVSEKTLFFITSCDPFSFSVFCVLSSSFSSFPITISLFYGLTAESLQAFMSSLFDFLPLVSSSYDVKTVLTKSSCPGSVLTDFD